jgi:hypothetical protein
MGAASRVGVSARGSNGETVDLDHDDHVLGVDNTARSTSDSAIQKAKEASEAVKEVVREVRELMDTSCATVRRLLALAPRVDEEKPTRGGALNDVSEFALHGSSGLVASDLWKIREKDPHAFDTMTRIAGFPKADQFIRHIAKSAWESVQADIHPNTAMGRAERITMKAEADQLLMFVERMRAVIEGKALSGDPRKPR